ncbi:hypothetical protein AAIH32_08940 [Pseudarthrobacter oxydans]|uniref:hypothetical protein n=1 Tax=Pseudarthrobacter oxydans TaxID=1671 RepID=UPI003D26FA28
MAQSQFDQFLTEATYRDPESGSILSRDAFYGLYTSWCNVSQETPQAEHVFWEAMAQLVGPGDELRMKGPAAADYILASYQAVI